MILTKPYFTLNYPMSILYVVSHYSTNEVLRFEVNGSGVDMSLS